MVLALPLLLVPFLLEESDRLSAEQSYDSNVGVLSTHERVVAADEIRTKTIFKKTMAAALKRKDKKYKDFNQGRLSLFDTLFNIHIAVPLICVSGHSPGFWSQCW